MEDKISDTQDNNGGNGSPEEEGLEPERIEKGDDAGQESKAESLEPEVFEFGEPIPEEDKDDDDWEEDEDN